ncbi:MAG: hypothetical protein ACHRXM_40095 [Isosphaerales bacterium]
MSTRSLSLSTPAHAQMTMADPDGMEDYGYGGYSYGYQTYGGFGLGYSQAVPAGGFIMDRFGMVYGFSGVATAPTTLAPRVRARNARAGSSRVAGQSQHQLPTGTLYWPVANRVILYSPAMRYRSYGDGSGRGPYGSLDYRTMYKGWPLGN